MRKFDIGFELLEKAAMNSYCCIHEPCFWHQNLKTYVLLYKSFLLQNVSLSHDTWQCKGVWNVKSYEISIIVIQFCN